MLAMWRGPRHRSPVAIALLLVMVAACGGSNSGSYGGGGGGGAGAGSLPTIAPVEELPTIAPEAGASPDIDALLSEILAGIESNEDAPSGALGAPLPPSLS